MTEGEGLAQSEGASGKLIDQRLGNVRRQVQGRVFMQPPCLLKLHQHTRTMNKNAVVVTCMIKQPLKIKTAHNQSPGVSVTDVCPYFINIYTDYEPFRIPLAIFILHV